MKAIILGLALLNVIVLAAGIVEYREVGHLNHKLEQVGSKANKFDSFCAQQSTYLGVIRGHLQSGKSSSAIEEFDDVFVSQAGKRELIMCLGGAAWNHDRAEDCSARKDVACMAEVASQTMALLDTATRDHN
ncbi:MAG TPA: hypothetical protein VGL61_21840 [Kofleriaceae bacterium]